MRRRNAARKAASLVSEAGYSSESHPQFWDSLREDEDDKAPNIIPAIGIDINSIAMIYVAIFQLAAAIVAAVPDQVRMTELVVLASHKRITS